MHRHINKQMTKHIMFINTILLNIYVSHFSFVLTSGSMIPTNHSYSAHSPFRSDTVHLPLRSSFFCRKTNLAGYHWTDCTIKPKGIVELTTPFQHAYCCNLNPLVSCEHNISSSGFAHVIHLQTLLLEGSVLVSLGVVLPKMPSNCVLQRKPKVKGSIWNC